MYSSLTLGNGVDYVLHRKVLPLPQLLQEKGGFQSFLLGDFRACKNSLFLWNGSEGQRQRAETFSQVSGVFLISILIGKGRVTLKVRITNGKD